jgi:flagellar motor switch/type III secretory pathway protein FliN
MIRNAAAPLPAPALFDSADDAWDMPLRREGQVMAEPPKTPSRAETGRALPTARGLLSPAEIEALLRPDLSDMPPEPPAPSSVAPRRVEEFGAATSTPGAEDMDLARRLAARLSMAMRESSGLPVAAMAETVRHARFDAALRQAGEERGQAIVCLAGAGGDVGAMLLFSPGFAHLLIETACGARARAGVAKPLSPMDIALLEAIVRPLAPAIGAGLGYASLETETVFAAAIAPPSNAVVIELGLRVHAETFRAHLILGAALTGQTAPDTPQAGPRSGANLPGTLSATLTARVASLAVPLSRLSGLKPGSTLLLGVPADQPVELVSGGDGGVVVADAEVGRRGNRVALRITRRSAALGPLTRASS